MSVGALGTSLLAPVWGRNDHRPMVSEISDGNLIPPSAFEALDVGSLDHCESGFPTTVYGIVVDRVWSRTSVDALIIWAPVYNTFFYSNNSDIANKTKHRSPFPVSFSWGKNPLMVEGMRRHSAVNVILLDCDSVRRANASGLVQTWGTATICNTNYTNHTVGLQINRGGIGTNTFKFESTTTHLHKDSHRLPTGTPVRFQTALIFPNGNKRSGTGTVVVTGLVFDTDRKNTSLGPLPSPSMISEVTDKLDSPVALILGSSPTIDCLAIGIPEILDYERDLRRTDIDTLIKHSVSVLQERLDHNTDLDSTQKGKIIHAIEVIET